MRESSRVSIRVHFLDVQLLDLVGLEFDHIATLRVDQVIVVMIGRFLVARAAVAEVVALDDAALLEQAHGAIDRGDRNARIDGDRAFVQLVHVRVGDNGIVGADQQALQRRIVHGH